jgi:(p)ppGpp synthase/HD superfamily hydrolase
MSYSYRIEQAIRAASVLHRGQVRKGESSFPYVTHLYAVAMLVADYTKDEDIIIAALLHDTIEDTDYTSEELHDDFGPTVRDIVLGVTEPPRGDSAKDSWKERKKQYLKQLKSAPHGSLMVAAADKIHNMRCVVEEYYDDHAKFLADFNGSLEERVMMYQEVSNILNRQLKSEILAEFNHVFDEYKKFIEYVIRERNTY